MDRPPAHPETKDTLCTAERVRSIVDAYDPTVERSRMLCDRYLLRVLDPEIESAIVEAARHGDIETFRTILSRLKTPAKRCRALNRFQSICFTRDANTFALLRQAERELEQPEPLGAEQLLQKEIAIVQASHALALFERNHDFMDALRLWEKSTALLAELPIVTTNADILLGKNHLNVALSYSRLGNAERVEEEYAAVLRILEQHPSLDRSLIQNISTLGIWLFERLGQYAEAEAQARWVLQTCDHLAAGGAADTGLAAALAPLYREERWARHLTELQLNTHKSLFAAVLAQGNYAEAEQQLPILRELMTTVDRQEQLHSEGEIHFVLGTYFDTAHQTALDTRKKLAAISDDAMLAEEPEQLRAQAISHFKKAQLAFAEGGLTYHAAEVDLQQILCEMRDGAVTAAHKERLFAALTTIERHLGVALFTLFGIGRSTTYQSPALAVAKRIITQIYPQESERESLARYYRDYSRVQGRRMTDAVQQHVQLDAEASEADVLAIGREMFGITALHDLHDETSAWHISRLPGLQRELIRWAHSEGQHVSGYDEALAYLRQQSSIVTIKHFYPGEMLAAPQAEAIETALVMFRGDTPRLIICDPSRHAPYLFAEQIVLSRLLGTLATETPQETLTQLIATATAGRCPVHSNTSLPLEKTTVEIFLETVGAPILPPRGDYVYLARPTLLRYGPDQSIDPLAVANVASLRELDPGQTYMEKYIGLPLEEACQQHRAELMRAGIIQDESECVGMRQRTGTVSGLALARDVRSHPLAGARQFHEAGKALRDTGNDFNFLTASKLVRGIFDQLGIPYYSFCTVTEADLDRAGYTGEQKDAWKKYFGLEAHVLLTRTDAIISGSGERIKTILTTS